MSNKCIIEQDIMEYLLCHMEVNFPQWDFNVEVIDKGQAYLYFENNSASYSSDECAAVTQSVHSFQSGWIEALSALDW